jgi:cellulose synthase/poly-beta-1,6-N-acetylglucosamine synthase-like glycosyltransferase
MTGFKVHCLGWHSVLCVPEQPAFLGSAPANAPDSLLQQKRWATGLLEIFVSNVCPFLNIHRNITVRQRMLYAYFNLWGIWSVATFCYAILPAFCLLSGKSFFPGISEPAFAIAVALFVSTYGFKLWEFLHIGSSIREWWNNQRMWLIHCLSPWIFAVFNVLTKLIGVSETVFVVTPKGSGDEDDCNEGDFTFDSSSLFIPPTTVLFINLVAILLGSVRFMAGKYDISRDKLFAEFFCSVWVVINLLPFVKGLVRKGKRGIPWTVVTKSAALALLLCCIWRQN